MGGGPAPPPSFPLSTWAPSSWPPSDVSSLKAGGLEGEDILRGGGCSFRLEPLWGQRCQRHLLLPAGVGAGGLAEAQAQRGLEAGYKQTSRQPGARPGRSGEGSRREGQDLLEEQGPQLSLTFPLGLPDP